MRASLAAALSLLFVSNALAQAPSGAQQTPPEQTQAPQPDTSAPQGKPTLPASDLGLSPDLTVEEVMDRLRRLLGLFSPFAPNGEAAVTSAAETRRGDVIVAVPVAPRRTGRLTTDLVQQRVLFSAERVVMPAGTPVYFTRFTYTVTSSYGATIFSQDYDAWCGVVTEGRRARPVSYCALESGGRRQVTRSTSGSPYWPRNMTAPVAAHPFTIDEDPGAASEFPRLELVYTFVEFDENDADVRRGVRVNGGDVVEVSNVSLVRQADGSSLLRVAGGELRINRTDARRVARVEVVTAPTSYDPDEEEAQLRLIAEQFVARMQAQRAGAEATPPAPTPAP